MSANAKISTISTIKQKFSRFLQLTTCFACICVLAACSGGDTNSASGKSDNNDLMKVSQKDFMEALLLHDVHQDEFVGNVEIGSKLIGPSSLTKVADSTMILIVDIIKKNKESNWIFTILSMYGGKENMYHDQINLKSSAGILNLYDVTSTRRIVEDSGSITEVGARELTVNEIKKFCEIVNTDSVKFRFRGKSDERVELTGYFTKDSLKNNQASCVVYSGIMQGFAKYTKFA